MNLSNTCRTATGAITALAIAALAIASAPLAQTPSSWTELSPPGGVNTAAFESGKTTAVYRDGLYMRVYSAITNRWYAHQPSFGTSHVIRDNFVAIPESDRWTAFSPYRGTFETLFVDFATTTWDNSQTVFVVRDGDTAHVFSTYTGLWHSHAVPASFNDRLEDRIAVFGDYTTVGPSDGAVIFDAVSGQWFDIPAQTGQLVTLTGPGTVLVQLTTESLGYSTQRGVLETLPAPIVQGGSTFYNGAAELVGRGGMTFSGLSGAVTQPPYPPPTPWYFTPTFSVSGNVMRAYEYGYENPLVLGMGGVWLPVPNGATPDGGGQTFMIFEHGDVRHAFSAVTNQWTSHTFSGGVSNSANSGDVALRVEASTGQPWLYRAATGQWHPAPAGTIPLPPTPSSLWRISPNAVLLTTATGIVGFSAHDGSFVPLAAPSSAVLLGGGTVLGARDANNLYVFDAPRSRWLTKAMPNLGYSPVSGNVMVVDDANEAVGYSARSGRLESLPLTELVIDRGSRTDVAWLQTATTVHMFSAFAEHLALTGAPFAAAVSRETIQRHQVQLDTGDIALFTLGPRANGPVPVPPFGTTWLDLPQTALVLLAQTTSEQRVEVTYTIPQSPSLRGSEWFVQPLMWPSVGTPYLADSQSFFVY